MEKAIIAKKIGMTQIFNENGEVIPVTVLEAGPCYVVQVKTNEVDGYEAVQVGFGAKKDKNTSKAQKVRFEKAGITGSLRTLKEFRLSDCTKYQAGDVINADVFVAGDKVDVHGVGKGKGYQGVIKRFNQHRGPMAHGSKYHRAVGSMGGSSDPSRVFKGKHLPGHMGNAKVTVQNLLVVRADAENNMILVKGAVPGSNGSVVTLTSSIKGSRA